MRRSVSLVLGTLIVETATLAILLQKGYGGRAVREWYSTYGVAAFGMDVMSIVFAVGAAGEVVKRVAGEENLVAICILSVTIQMSHDILFGRWLQTNDVDSPVLNLFKRYADEMGKKILYADMVMVLTTAILSSLLQKSDIGIDSSLVLLSLLSYSSLLLVYSFQ